MRCLGLSLVVLIGGLSCQSVCGQQPATDQHSAAEKKLVDVARQLSTTTLVDGPGWEKYQEFLHDDFDRWSAGQGTWGRERTVQAIREWWESGNRMSSSEEEIVSVQVVGTTGAIRKSIHEQYLDGEGNETGEFRGFVTQVWVTEDGRWQLLAVSIEPMKEE